MLAKVIKCSGKDYWYKRYIGDTFIVEELDEFHYEVVNDDGELLGLLKEDCELIVREISH